MKRTKWLVQSHVNGDLTVMPPWKDKDPILLDRLALAEAVRRVLQGSLTLAGMPGLRARTFKTQNKVWSVTVQNVQPFKYSYRLTTAKGTSGWKGPYDVKPKRRK